MPANLQAPPASSARLSAIQLRRRYIVALSLIALLTITAQALMQVLISDQEYDSRVVNIAGRQRMLSQKITKLSYYVSNAASAASAARLREELMEALGLWERSHVGLLRGDKAMGLPGTNSAQVVALFERIQPHYEAIVAAAGTIVAASGGDAALAASIRSLREHEAEFLNGMDEIVFRYDREANAKVEFARRLEIGLMAVTLLVLVLEAAFIFAPATRRIERDMQELADREQDLELLFAVSPTALLLVDSGELTILHANQKAASLLGVPTAEIVGSRLDRFLDQSRDAHRDVLARIVGGDSRNEDEVVLVDAGGLPIEALMSVRAIRFSGRPVLVLGITNITEFRKAQQTLAAETRSVEEKNRELALLYEITTYLAEPASREAVCKGVLLKLGQRLGVRGGAVRLVNAVTGELELVVTDNMPESFIKAEARLPMTSCLCGHAAIKGASVTEGLVGSPRNVRLLNNCKQCGFAAMAAIPIWSKNQVLGVLTLFFDDVRILAAHELRLLEAIGLHLGVVIENLRLVVREKEMAVSEERNLLAQELHDSIAQSLAFLNIQAQMLQASLRQGQPETAAAELALMREGIQESYDNVRELLVHFRIRVDHAELDDAIRSALEKFEGQTGVRAFLRKEGDGVVPAATSTIQVLHIIQEALSNVRKHAGATQVEVTLRGDAAFSIAVRDDGKGFDPAQVMEDGGSHVGIGIMRERAHRIGARLELDAAPGRGTCVTLVLPR
ncbi:MAG: type IV pili methyl-accepting chemotaxis transducer N-terminal domain-containing protein [Rhodocyclales bacterium]|nr:type IV pili methyl-accepting chemotaxis transducer N-terminal domain-containing protein [Rhodocyclales bacterium]